MDLVNNQKDLVVALKKETLLNFGLLKKRQAMPVELSRQVFAENALEKPTQNLFNHLSHYLVSIIDHAASASLPWPLYDTKAERAYRHELSNFIADCSNKGLLAPVMSSYLVNPGCFKVTKLLYQMSQLAVLRLLFTMMKKDSQKKLYNNMTEYYKAKDKRFLVEIEKKTELIQSKFSNYLQKRKVMGEIAMLFRKKITEMEGKTLKSQKFLDDFIDGYVLNCNLDKVTNEQILQIKDVKKISHFFDNWLIETDKQIDELESKWTEKVSPLLTLSQNTQSQTEQLISRCTGEADKNTYMIEYNHKIDFICTKELQGQVNCEQQYILKNIVKNEKLSYPNLIRGFIIAISFVLKNAEIGDEISKFNEYLDVGQKNYSELVETMKSLIERILNAEAMLQPSPLQYHYQGTTDIPEIPPLPDLSDLLNISKLQCQAIFDSSPPGISKHQFNLQRKKGFNFAKPQPKSILVMPYSQGPKDDFLKSLISCRVSSYDQPNHDISHNLHNLSLVSQCCRSNETIAECSGFSKQQIMRLLSTKKKSSSSKKYRYKTDRPDINIKKGGLFNESISSNESNRLYRSLSSPNLYENRENANVKEPSIKAGRSRKLSIMPEDNTSPLEVSGIIALDKGNKPTLPKNNIVSIPVISITPAVDRADMLQDFDIDFNLNDTPKQKTETPKPDAQLIKKTSSLEKIIKRFKRVRASVIPEKSDNFVPIAEEKENFSTNTVNVKRVLLPDLLSPSTSMLSDIPGSEHLDKVCGELDEKVERRPRESLGTALGIDHTFLDQLNASLEVTLTED